MLYLNPYVCLIKADHLYQIFVTAGITVQITEEEMQFLRQGLPCDNDSFIAVMGAERFRNFLDLNIVVQEKISIDEIDSVNHGWFMNQESSGKYQELKKKTILILGCGGLGTHMAWNMVALGVGEIILVDDDVVEISNLNRQLLYNRDDLGLPKIEQLKQHLLELNHNLTIHTISRKINDPEEDLTPILEKFEPIDLVVKAIDTPANHLEIFSEYFHRKRLPYVSGATVGHMMLFGPTYHPELENKYVHSLPKNQGIELIQGKGISLPMIMQRISAEVASEALRLLLGRYESVKYNESVVFEDILGKAPLQRPKEEAVQNSTSVDGAILASFVGSVTAVVLLQHFGLTLLQFLFQFSLSILYGALQVKSKLYFLYLVCATSILGGVQLIQNISLMGTFNTFFNGVSTIQSMGIFILTAICFNTIIFFLLFFLVQQLANKWLYAGVLARIKRPRIMGERSQTQMG